MNVIWITLGILVFAFAIAWFSDLIVSIVHFFDNKDNIP